MPWSWGRSADAWGSRDGDGWSQHDGGRNVAVDSSSEAGSSIGAGAVGAGSSIVASAVEAREGPQRKMRRHNTDDGKQYTVYTYIGGSGKNCLPLAVRVKLLNAMDSTLFSIIGMQVFSTDTVDALIYLTTRAKPNTKVRSLSMEPGELRTIFAERLAERLTAFPNFRMVRLGGSQPNGNPLVTRKNRHRSEGPPQHQMLRATTEGELLHDQTEAPCKLNAWYRTLTGAARGVLCWKRAVQQAARDGDLISTL